LTPREAENAFLKGHVEILLAEGVRHLETSGLPPKDLLPALKEAGAKVMHKTSTVRHAVSAAKLGVDVVAVVGAECGGHPGRQLIGTMVQTPLAAERVSLPLVIGGGIGHGSQVTAALAMGADAVLIGTRMLAAAEINAHAAYKARMLEADEGSSRLIMQSFRNTYRVLDNSDARSVAELEEAGERDYERFKPFVAGSHQKHAYDTGDWERGVLSMGQSIAFAHEPQTVAEIYAQLLREAAAARDRLASLSGNLG
jgi:nitronate monooxygenase